MLKKTKIGKVVYNGNEYGLFLSSLDPINDIACSIDLNEIYVKNSYFKKDENNQECFMWHELGHIINHTGNEYVADKFACERVGCQRFIDAIDSDFLLIKKRLSTARRDSFRNYQAYRINVLDELPETPTIEETYEIVLDKGLTIEKIKTLVFANIEGDTNEDYRMDERN